LASVFLFLHSAWCPLSNHPLSFLFSVSFNSQNLPVVSFSLPPVFYSSLLLCLSLFFFCFPEHPPLESVICFSPSPKFFPPSLLWFLLWYL
jgi:hypothetical protein